MAIATAQEYEYKLNAKLELLEEELDKNKDLEVEANILKKREDKIENQIDNLRKHREHLVQAKTDFGDRSTQVNKKVLKDLESIINKALKTAFPYLNLELIMAPKTSSTGSRRTSLELSLIENGNERDLSYLASKGVQQVISLLQIVTQLVISNKARIIFIDEGLTGISDENVDTVVHLLAILSEKLDFQFILNEHNSSLWEKSNDPVRVIKLSNENNQARVESSYEV